MSRGTGAVNQSPTSVRPGRGDAVDDVPVAVAAVFADQAVAFQAVEGGVDLPDVQRPGGPGAVLEFGPELVPVARPVLQEGEEAVTDGHGAPRKGSGTTAYTRPKTRVYRVWNYIIVFGVFAAKQRMSRTDKSPRTCGIRPDSTPRYMTSRTLPTWSPESK